MREFTYILPTIIFFFSIYNLIVIVDYINYPPSRESSVIDKKIGFVMTSCDYVKDDDYDLFINLCKTIMAFSILIMIISLIGLITDILYIRTDNKTYEYERVMIWIFIIIIVTIKIFYVISFSLLAKALSLLHKAELREEGYGNSFMGNMIGLIVWNSIFVGLTLCSIIVYFFCCRNCDCNTYSYKSCNNVKKIVVPTYNTNQPPETYVVIKIT
jgi:hypothetical protein